MLWNFSTSAANVQIDLEDMPGRMAAKPIVLDAMTTNNDEIARLKPENAFSITVEKPQIQLTLEPYQIRFWSLEKK